MNFYLTSYTKTNSKQTIDLNVNPKTMQIFRREANVHNLELGKFLNMIPKPQVIKEKQVIDSYQN